MGLCHPDATNVKVIDEAVTESWIQGGHNELDSGDWMPMLVLSLPACDRLGEFLSPQLQPKFKLQTSTALADRSVSIQATTLLFQARTLPV